METPAQAQKRRVQTIKQLSDRLSVATRTENALDAQLQAGKQIVKDLEQELITHWETYQSEYYAAKAREDQVVV